MQRRIGFWLIVLPGLFLLTGCSEPQSRTMVSEDDLYMLIDKEGYTSQRKGPVRFTHDKHFEDYGIDCTECHHEFEDGENVWTEDDEAKTCEICHDPNATRGNAYKLRIAFHKNCRGCHRYMSEEAPYKCAECHEPVGEE